MISRSHHPADWLMPVPAQPPHWLARSCAK